MSTLLITGLSKFWQPILRCPTACLLSCYCSRRIVIRYNYFFFKCICLYRCSFANILPYIYVIHNNLIKYDKVETKIAFHATELLSVCRCFGYYYISTLYKAVKLVGERYTCMYILKLHLTYF
jgi:hypothetical protein